MNPQGQIPTIVLEDNRVLYDSLVICMYLDQLSGQENLVPSDGRKRIDVMRRHALGNGLIEDMVLWVMDRYSPPEKQIAARLERYALKLKYSLPAIEADPEMRDPLRFDLGDIAIATALAYIEFRKLKPGWQTEFPETAGWFAQISRRPSMIAAQLQDG